MAITVIPTITPVSVPNKIVNISAVISNDSTQTVHSVRVDNVSVEGGGGHAMQKLICRYNSIIENESEIDTWLKGKELAAKTYLEGQLNAS